MLKLSLAKLDDFLALLAEKQKVYLPVDTEAGAQYLPYEKGLTLSDSLNTVRSAKDFFFPQTETLMEFRIDGKKLSIVDTRSETEDFVLFGVRACDVRSFAILDRVFLSEPVDTYYQNRRAHGIVFSMACNRPAESCFCSTFGIDAAQPEGDVVCVRTDDALYLDPKSEKGKALCASLASLLTECDSANAEKQQALIRERIAKTPLASLSADSFGGDKTEKFFKDPAWKSLSEACLGCGTCTFVCPTCQCYDIKDFKTSDGVRRFRCWDSCMYSEFTKMSAGQPRLTQLERFRQRFMHKLVYYPANNDGIFGCVGCGRCVRSCPISMNIVKVMKKLGEGDKENG